MHWTDRRSGKAALAHALADRGWQLFGYTPDASDSMTDLYLPAHWSGIATKDGAVVVVDYPAKYPAAAANDSGKREERHVPTAGDACPRCLELPGIDPSRWTIQDARREPDRYHRETIEIQHGPDSGVSALLNVISPIPFLPDGRLKCLKCHGAGRLPGKPTIEIAAVWPIFRHNPEHALWHVERGGRILAKGVGLAACAKFGKEGQIAAEALAAKIDEKSAPKASRPRPDAASATAANAEGIQVTVAENEERDGIELIFSAKPGTGIREALKANGFRWSSSQGLWYAKRSPDRRRFAETLAAAMVAPTSN